LKTQDGGFAAQHIELEGFLKNFNHDHPLLLCGLITKQWNHADFEFTSKEKEEGFFVEYEVIEALSLDLKKIGRKIRRISPIVHERQGRYVEAGLEIVTLNDNEEGKKLVPLA